MSNRTAISVVVLVLASGVGGLLILIFSPLVVRQHAEVQLPKVDKASALSADRDLVYMPPQPGEAPLSIRDAVQSGHNILVNTRQAVPDHVGNQLVCQDCHFQGGITDGGRRGGISLVGASARYPQNRKETSGLMSLTDMVNHCFEVNLLGKPLPAESRSMQNMLAYLQWISRGIPPYTEITWLGLDPLKSEHDPDLSVGRDIHEEQCAPCHGKDGLGSPFAPPQWGPESFSTASRMSRRPILAAFIHLNMPKQQPDLTPKQAVDAAAYLLRHERPRGPQPQTRPAATTRTTTQEGP